MLFNYTRHSQRICGLPALQHMQGLFRLCELNLRDNDGLRAPFVQCFMTLRPSLNRNQLVFNSEIIAEKVVLMTL